jgi:Flp pilus assembly protein TadG
MLKKFLRNQDGNYAAIFAIAMLPIIASVGLAVDYSNISRLKHSLGDSTDAAGLAVSKMYVTGEKTDGELRDLASKFFAANFDPKYLSHTVVEVTFPHEAGNTTKELKVKATLSYKTLFGPAIAALMNSKVGDNVVVIQTATLKMRSLAEIALVLDNSGSMSDDKTGNSTSIVANQRITLLKKASKKLIETMITAGQQVEQVKDPVKFSIIPFSASVKVVDTNASDYAGPDGSNSPVRNAMDVRGVSPIHHEHLNWGTPGAGNPTGYVSNGPDGAKLDASGNPLTRFSIYNGLQFRAGGTEATSQCKVWKDGASDNSTSSCSVFKRAGAFTDVGASSLDAATAIASSTYNLSWLEEKYAWQGCVEMRPGGHDVTDAAPSAGTPATLYVPMFAPDEYNKSQFGSGTPSGGYNNWWPDYEAGGTFPTTGYWPTYNDGGQVNSMSATSSTWWASTSRPRMTNVAKYFANKVNLSGQGSPTSGSGRVGEWRYYRGEAGPNQSCTTTAITPLTANTTKLNAAIDAMSPTGNTNVPEGLAWGWRTISSTAPFTEGTSETRKDMDKVVIVLTDGANTYADLSQQDRSDVTGTQSTYAAFGYSGYAGNGGVNGTATLSDASNIARIFKNTTASTTTHDSTNFQKAMDDKMTAICTNIKDKKIMLMTVALDLNPNNVSGTSAKAAVNKAIQTLTNCAGYSRVKKDASGNPAKLFWNATSDTLDDTFKEIADELSNLRFTG